MPSLTLRPYKSFCLTSSCVVCWSWHLIIFFNIYKHFQFPCVPGQAHLVAPEGYGRWPGWQQAGSGPAAGGTAPLEKGRGQPDAALASQTSWGDKPEQPGSGVIPARRALRQPRGDKLRGKSRDRAAAASVPTYPPGTPAPRRSGRPRGPPRWGWDPRAGGAGLGFRPLGRARARCPRGAARSVPLLGGGQGGERGRAAGPPSRWGKRGAGPGGGERGEPARTRPAGMRAGKGGEGPPRRWSSIDLLERFCLSKFYLLLFIWSEGFCWGDRRRTEAVEPRAGGLSLLLCPGTSPPPPHSRLRAAGAAVGTGLGRGSGLRRSAHSGGLAGRRLHVNKSRTSSDICREPCCPYTHSFFTPRGRFVTGGGLPICRRWRRPRWRPRPSAGTWGRRRWLARSQSQTGGPGGPGGVLGLQAGRRPRLLGTGTCCRAGPTPL